MALQFSFRKVVCPECSAIIDSDIEVSKKVSCPDCGRCYNYVSSIDIRKLFKSPEKLCGFYVTGGELGKGSHMLNSYDSKEKCFSIFVSNLNFKGVISIPLTDIVSGNVEFC